MLVQHLRRWPDNKPALAERPLFTGYATVCYLHLTIHCEVKYVKTMLEKAHSDPAEVLQWDIKL